MELQLIQSKIFEIRGTRVMLDFDLAALYQVETRSLKQSVRRNIDRFEGDDFMFTLTKEEWGEVITNCDNLPQTVKFSPSLPMAFTEQGVAMLSSILRSKTAININRGVIRAFVAMRQYLTGITLQGVEIAELRERVKALERGGEENLEAVNDLSEDVYKEIDNIYLAIGELSVKPAPQVRRQIGYGQPWKDQE